MILSAPLRSIGLTILAMFLFSTSVNAQDDMRLLYDYNSGNVQIEIINPMINLFSVETLGPTASPGTGFLLFNSVDSSTVVGAPVGTPPANQDTIAFLSTSNPFPVGTVDLGNILPPEITFAATDATNSLFIGTDAAGNSVGFGALAYTVTGSPGNPGFSGQAPIITSIGVPALCGDIDLDGSVTFLDIVPFIEILATNGFQAEADCDLNGAVNFLDIAPFIAALAAP